MGTFRRGQHFFAVVLFSSTPFPVSLHKQAVPAPQIEERPKEKTLW